MKYRVQYWVEETQELETAEFCVDTATENITQTSGKETTKFHKKLRRMYQDGIAWRQSYSTSESYAIVQL